MSDNEIKSRLLNLYNCKIVKMGIGDERVMVESKKKTIEKKVLGLFPTYRYESEKYPIYFDRTFEFAYRNNYGRVFGKIHIAVAYDVINRVVYWKRVFNKNGEI